MRFFAPLSPIALSPGLPGWMETFGTPLRKATRAICGISILGLEKFWKSWKCLTESTFQGSSPMAAISFSAAEEKPGRSG